MQDADRGYGKVAAVGGDTDQQPYTDVRSRIVQEASYCLQKTATNNAAKRSLMGVMVQ